MRFGCISGSWGSPGLALFGAPWDVRLWVAFAAHDLGYLGKNDVEGRDGATHVELGASIRGFFFGDSWADFVACHSRYWAKRINRQVSALCIADKLAFVLTPAWLYLPMTRATGELAEYMLPAKERQAESEYFTAEESTQLSSTDERVWLAGLKSYTRRWVEAHRDGREDTRTVASREEGMSDVHAGLDCRAEDWSRSEPGSSRTTITRRNSMDRPSGFSSGSTMTGPNSMATMLRGTASVSLFPGLVA
jgi:hypothetical protein